MIQGIPPVQKSITKSIVLFSRDYMSSLLTINSYAIG